MSIFSEMGNGVSSDRCKIYNSVERAEWDGNNVTSTQVINNHGENCFNPIVFETAPDQCKEFCSENFCYDV
ncbi:unnamed protein product [Oikopleura dioica]|uniref:Uncharacterized protein n=1 Tax=Oikopleura dioica TaxID=34765 RepID=E4XLD9_OIKDI|nr:unnamed protein product [Oikopleura dioica]